MSSDTSTSQQPLVPATMAEPNERDLDRSAYSFVQHLEPLENDGKNFKSWKIRMLKALELGEVDGVVTGTEVLPPHPTEAEQRAFRRKTRRALALITTKLGEEELQQVEGLSAAATWSFLRSKFDMRTQDVFKTILASAKLLRAKSNSDIPSFLQEHERVLAEARKVSFPIVEPAPAGASDEVKMKHVGMNMVYTDMIFDGLPKTAEWATFTKVYDLDKASDYSPRQVLDGIRSQYQTSAARSVSTTSNPLLPTSSSSTGTALATAKPSPRATCPFCQRKKPNHPPEKCFDNPANPDNKIEEKKKKEKAEKDKKKKEKGKEKASGAAAASPKDDDDDVVHVTIAAPSSNDTSLRHDEGMWFLDSCASSSLAHSRSSFKMYVEKDEIIKTATGASMRVVGSGSVVLRAKVGGATKIVTLTDVLHVPTSAFNLVSLPKITSAGCTASFSSDGRFEIRKDGQIVLMGSKKDYNLPSIALSPTSVAAAAGSSEARLEVVRQAHRRYGHPGKGQLRDLLKSGAVKGFTTIDLDAFYETTCRPCRLGKATKLPFPTSPNWAERPLERIHSDLAGPILESYSGCRYFVILFDEATGWIDARPLKSKEEVKTAVSDMLAVMKQEFKECEPPRFRIFQSDQGTEYTSAAFRSFLADEGYKHETSVAYRPQQNGRSERAIRTVKEKVTTLLAEANISRRYWAEALFYASYLLQDLPTAAVDGKTPYYFVHGHHRDFLCTAPVFGQTVFTVNDGAGTFEEKASEAIFLGVGAGRGMKAIRVHLSDYPDGQGMKWSRDFRFSRKDVPDKSRPVVSVGDEFWDDDDEIGPVGGVSGSPAAEELGEFGDEPEKKGGEEAGEGKVG
ncbi:hypothetical protein JCM11251_005561 [Rhodosporidiobolus azoricus]